MESNQDNQCSNKWQFIAIKINAYVLQYSVLKDDAYVLQYSVHLNVISCGKLQGLKC